MDIPERLAQELVVQVLLSVAQGNPLELVLK
jgi:hypothetical protein